MKQVCIFGASGSKIDKEYIDAAYRVGELLAKNNIGMVFGGGSTGLMGACARGVYDNGGSIIGVIPEKLNRPGIAFENCTELIVTPDMHTRKATMEKLSEGFITLAGGFGTLEELMEVMTLNQLGYIDSPVVILNTKGYYDKLIAQFKECIAQGFTSEACMDIYWEAHTPEEAIDLLINKKRPQLPDKLEYALRFAKGEAET